MAVKSIKVKALFSRSVPFEAWGCCTRLESVEAGKVYDFEIASDAILEPVVKSLTRNGAFEVVGATPPAEKEKPEKP